MKKNEALEIAVQAYEDGWYGLARAIKKLKTGNLIWTHYSTTTRFLNDLADNLKLNIRTVQRFIKANDLIAELTPEVAEIEKDLNSNEIKIHVSNISNTLSPHSLEQLHQLKQVMPADHFEKIRVDFFAERLNRDDLRREWLNFKGAITGKVRRKPVEGYDSQPTVDTKRVQKAVSVKQIRDMFTEKFAKSSKLITMTASQTEGLPLPAYDIICIEKTGDDELPKIHGICLITDSRESSITGTLNLADGCDYFWLSLPTISNNIDAKIGLIHFETGKPEVYREASCQPDNPKKISTLRNLLLKCHP